MQKPLVALVVLSLPFLLLWGFLLGGPGASEAELACFGLSGNDQLHHGL